MTKEANLKKTEHGLVPEGEGWFVVNASESAWGNNEKFGEVCGFAGDVRFSQLGINIHVIHPGQPSCFYHAEKDQEDFLVLSGECILLVQGEEKSLKAWDFFHCPSNTEHVFVGAGKGPCAILMVGARSGHNEIVYPENTLAQKHGAGVEKTTNSPKEAYASCPEWKLTKGNWPLAPEE